MSPSGGVGHANAINWLAIVGLLFLVIALVLAVAADVALEHWYFLLVPLFVAGFRFGLHGAALASLVAVLVLLLLYWAAGQSFLQAAEIVERLVMASTSPEEARQLAATLMRGAAPQLAAYPALFGLLFSMMGALVLGAAVDRARSAEFAERSVRMLRRYFSPEIVDRILGQSDGETPTAISTRREVTMLFADLRNFTALSERLEPEETAQLLSEFFTAMTEEIYREGGTVDKYLGDGIMAFFGDPVWHPDHPERAFRAALAMQERMGELQPLWRAEGRGAPQMGIGIATGYAIMGNTGPPTRLEYTAIGSIVNVASRLSELADGGTILTTRKTYWRVQQDVDGVGGEPMAVKGFAQPIEVVQIVGARLIPQTLDMASRERLLPLVSRVMEDSGYRASILAGSSEAAGLPKLREDERALAKQVAALWGHPLLEGVPAGEVATLMAEAAVEEVAQGAVIVRQGAARDNFYVILEGSAVVTISDEGGQESHVASLAPGDFFGEVAMLYDTPRNATVRAGARSRLMVLDPEAFYRVLEGAPGLRGKIEARAKSRMTQPLQLHFADEALPTPSASGSSPLVLL